MPDHLHDLARRHVEATERFLKITVFDGEHATIGRLAAAMGATAAAVRKALDGHPGSPAATCTTEQAEATRRCPRCGSPRWLSVSLDEGWTRHAQCVPCGAIHPGVIEPGWKATPKATKPPCQHCDGVQACHHCGTRL